jgi:hypothetical protein
VALAYLLPLVFAATANVRAGEEGGLPVTGAKPPISGQPAARSDRVALADTGDPTRGAQKIVASAEGGSSASEETAAIGRALKMIADCRARYQAVDDYVCTFYKRERIDGNLTPLHVMAMKVRTRPQSIYFKFQRPARGREAIYIAGKNDGKVLAHDVGFNKFFAGTLALEPTGSRAMEENRHPITEAGIGPLIDTLARRWATELSVKDSRMAFHEEMRVGTRPCVMIESVHPHRHKEFLFHKVRVYIDKELGLPIRFEAYDWPKLPHSEPELTEEYTYGEVKLNVGLKEIDFDTSNKEYAFGHF